jgi:hypothetical protein
MASREHSSGSAGSQSQLQVGRFRKQSVKRHYALLPQLEKNFMKTFLTTLLLLGSFGLGMGATTINATNKYAYGANIGWMDWSGDVANGAVPGFGAWQCVVRQRPGPHFARRRRDLAHHSRYQCSHASLSRAGGSAFSTMNAPLF